MLNKIKTVFQNKKFIRFTLLTIFTCMLLFLIFYKILIVRNINIKFDTNNFINIDNIRSYIIKYSNKPLYSFPKSLLITDIRNIDKWVDKIDLNKKFPDTLNITIYESKPSFCVKQDNKYYVVSNNRVIQEVDKIILCPYIIENNTLIKIEINSIIDSPKYSCASLIYENSQKVEILSEILKNSNIVISDDEYARFNTQNTVFELNCSEDIQHVILYTDYSLLNYDLLDKCKTILIEKNQLLCKK